ncbi:MAG: sugar phosphate isomerase/epimerase family protein [Trueperaceae bacterium]
MAKYPPIVGHTLATPELNLESAVELFSRLGLDGVEIVQDDGYACGLSSRPDPGELINLRRQLESAGLTAWHITPYVRTLDSADDDIRSEAIADVKNAIEVADFLGARGVRILAGRREGEGSTIRFERFLDSMRKLATIASLAAVSLNIETKGWSFGSTTDSMLRLIRGIDSPAVGILFDPANLVLDGENASLALRGQLAWVRHVHVKDVLVGDGGEGRFTRLGTGSVPWRDLLQQLRQAGFNGALSLEYERRWDRDLEPFDEIAPADITLLRSTT